MPATLTTSATVPNKNRAAAPAGSVLELPAPGKINRFLRVRHRRADGFHELATLFQFVEWSDLLRFEGTDAPRIRRIDRHDFALPAEDLCVRAAQLLRAAGPPANARGALITLTKTIPPGSGLGGGSSNAATTLIALNRLWQLGLPRDRLAELGLELGADVSLFVRGRAARAGGVGEILAPCAPAEKWLCICMPPVAVSTARVFAHLQIDGRDDGDPIGDETGNDLETAAAQLYPEVGDALAWLRARAGEAHMSGSGGAVYAEFASRAEAERIAATAPAGLRARVARALNRHPLADFS